MNIRIHESEKGSVPSSHILDADERSRRHSEVMVDVEERYLIEFFPHNKEYSIQKLDDLNDIIKVAYPDHLQRKVG